MVGFNPFQNSLRTHLATLSTSLVEEIVSCLNKTELHKSLQLFGSFLVATKRLYMRVCPSVGWMDGPSDGWMDGNKLFFSANKERHMPCLVYTALFLDASSHLYKMVHLSVRPSVRR